MARRSLISETSRSDKAGLDLASIFALEASLSLQAGEDETANRNNQISRIKHKVLQTARA
eukprot:COSAG06_NODE_4169_length_4504_cov_125.786606_7_plen_60_part_00